MPLRAVRKLFTPFAAGLIVSIVVVLGVFLITLVWRRQLGSGVTIDRMEIVTAQVYAWLQNWVHEGAFSIHFTMPYRPLSIESFDLRHREELYRSYPPGVLVPPYLLFLLYKQAPIGLLTGYGLACHAISVISTVVAVFLVTVRAAAFVAAPRAIAPVLPATLLAISAGIFMSVASGPSYFFARVYVFDTAVLPWFGVVIALEAIYTCKFDAPVIARTALALQMVVFTIGLWIDWLFVVLFLVWLALRIVEPLLGIRGAVSARRAVCVGAAVASVNLALIFAWRVQAGIDQSDNYGVGDELLRTFQRFVYRTGVSDSSMSMAAYLYKVDVYLAQYFSVTLDQLAKLLVASSLSIVVAFILVRRFGRASFLWPLLSVAALSTVTVVVHFGLLPHHTFYHDFTILKFAFPMALLVLTLAPAAVAVLSAKASEQYLGCSPAAGETICSVLVCAAAISGIYFSMTRYDAPQRHFPPVQGGIGALGTVIARNVEYSDVVFSPQFEIARMTREAGFSRKLVYRSSDPDKDLATVAENVCRPFNLVIVSNDLEPVKRAAPPTEVWRDSGLVFHRWRNLPAIAQCTSKSP
jgi:hypothetical protein